MISKRKAIYFTAPREVEYIECDIPELGKNDVLVRNEFTVISGGTERASLLAVKNVPYDFPRALGYSGVGHVLAVGENVTSVKPGDRVLVYHGIHANYNVRGEDEITKVDIPELSSEDAVFVIIASMGLGGLRRLEVEIGESVMVMGLGLLGIFALQFARLSGAYPVIAADLNEERRKLALELGADYALDPSAPDFEERVKELTGGKGVNAIVEVTGVMQALKQALNCSAREARISLLGCTRVSDGSVDYYSEVHRPGIRLIGAHNMVRPKFESRPHCWTHHDDCRAIMALLAAGRIKVGPICSRIVSPTMAKEIFDQLINDPDFPMGTVFDWRDIE